MMYLYPIIGGILIGAASGLLFRGIGKVAGISGIAHGFIWSGDRWRFAFVLGLVAAGLVLQQFLPMTDQAHIASAGGILIAGLLVGFGVRLANGCTSGHGVCGVGRFSQRSIAATLTFISTGALVVLIRGLV